MITEQQIDDIISKVGASDKFFEALIDTQLEKHESYFSYVEADSEVLYQEEVDYLVGILAVILELCKDLDLSDIEQIEEIEDENWSLLHESKNMQAAFDSTFKKYPEEDLLAYIEDAIIIDEEDEDEDFSFLTKVGKEFIFVKAKSVVDIYIKKKKA